MNNKISNPKTEVPKTIALNDCNYVNIILEQEKNISNNYSIAINEASNKTLYQKEMEMFQELKETARNLYDFMFQNGWYSLEKEEQQKITQKTEELTQKLNEMIG